MDMCSNYTTTGYPTFKPRCRAGLMASLKCHSKNDCPKYNVVSGSISTILLDEYANYPEGAKDEKVEKLELP